MFSYHKEYKGLLRALYKETIRGTHGGLSPSIVKTRFEHIGAIIFEVTEGCNLNCEYCGYGDNYLDTKYRPRGRGENLRWSTAKTLLDYYLPLWNTSSLSDYYISYYGGEPLLNFQIIQQITDYLERNKSNNTIIHYSITTNGLLLAKYIDFLVKYDFRVSVSLDGDERADKFRRDKLGNPSFRVVEHNIRVIQEKYPSFFEKNIYFQAVITRNSSTLDVYRYFSNEYGKLPLAIEVSTEGLALNNNIHKYYLDLDRDIVSNYSYHISEYKRYGIQNPQLKQFEHSIKTLSFTFNNYYSLLNRHEEKSIRTPTCKPVGDRVFMSATGLLYQCEKVKFDFPIGQIINGRILLDFGAIATNFNRIFACYKEMCYCCLHQLNCQHCIATTLGYSDINHYCTDFEAINEHNIKVYISYLREYSKSLNSLLERKESKDNG